MLRAFQGLSTISLLLSRGRGARVHVAGPVGVAYAASKYDPYVALAAFLGLVPRFQLDRELVDLIARPLASALQRELVELQQVGLSIVVERTIVRPGM